VKVVVVWTVNGGIEISQIYLKKNFICVPKMNKIRMGFEQHEGE